MAFLTKAVIVEPCQRIAPTSQGKVIERIAQTDVTGIAHAHGELLATLMGDWSDSCLSAEGRAPPPGGTRSVWRGGENSSSGHRENDGSVTGRRTFDGVTHLDFTS